MGPALASYWAPWGEIPPIYPDFCHGGPNPASEQRKRQMSRALTFASNQQTGRAFGLLVLGALSCLAVLFGLAGCSGSGSEPGTTPETCGTCQGAGQVAFRRGFLSVAQTCPSCGGAGRVSRDPCVDCAGKGRSEREVSLNVTVPAGVDSGMRLRLAGEGEGGSLGGPPGDLFVVIAIAEHDLFERDGVDLHLEFPISAYQAMLGTTVAMTTILGEERKVEVPAGAQPGEVIRLSGSGMPHVNGRRRGDLHVHLRVVVPKRVSAEQRRLIEEAAALGGGLEPEMDRGFFDRVKRAFGGGE